MDTTTLGVTVSCNVAFGTGDDLGVGAVADGTFSRNAFRSVFLSNNLREYWSAEGNRWNGTTLAPASSVLGSITGC
jgi:hypothetical protein